MFIEYEFELTIFLMVDLIIYLSYKINRNWGNILLLEGTCLKMRSLWQTFCQQWLCLLRWPSFTAEIHNFGLLDSSFRSKTGVCFIEHKVI